MVRVKYIVALLSILLSYNVLAQTQQGIVKTRGRMVNGQLEAGTRLSGATITLNFGNSLVSGSQGGFSFNVPSGKTYSLVMAEKKGYTLADPEYTRRSFTYSSSNPFYVVLEEENQRLADINAATRTVRRTLTAQLQKREEEIEALKKQNKLTEEEYQKRLQELYDNQSKSEQLVKEMAERYATTDYDLLDEFNRQVQMYIEEGELQKADSMIRSKGDMEKRVEEYHNVVAANQKTRDQLEQSEAGAAKTYEDLSQDLFRRSEIFLQAFQHDSALYCLKLRADLDTAKVTAVWSYAVLCHKQKKFSDCEKYFLICLRSYISQNDIPYIASIQNNLGALYKNLHDYANSEKFYMSALENREQLFRQNPNAYRADLAMTCWNMMLLYAEMNDSDQYDLYLEKSLSLYCDLYKSQPTAYSSDVIELQNRKVWRLLVNGNVNEAYNLAQETYGMDESNEMSKNYLAWCNNSKAYDYAKASDFVNAHKSIDIAISIVPYDPTFYDSKGEILLMQGNNDEALKMWKKVLELNPDFLKDYPDGTDLSNGLKKLGLIE